MRIPLRRIEICLQHATPHGISRRANHREVRKVFWMLLQVRGLLDMTRRSADIEVIEIVAGVEDAEGPGETIVAIEIGILSGIIGIGGMIEVHHFVRI